MRIVKNYDDAEWPPMHAGSKMKNEVTVTNVEFTEPQSHIFHGYTNKGKYGAVADKDIIHFHQPNKVDFQIEPQTKENSFKHFVAGGIAGCVASTLTCPLDVVKTRQQSSGHSQGMFSRNPYLPMRHSSKIGIAGHAGPLRKNELLSKCRQMQMSQVSSAQAPYIRKLVSSRGANLILNSSILQHCRYIVKVEGVLSLWKGLGPTLAGVVPSRAIYFMTYSTVKKKVASSDLVTNYACLHVISAAAAGFCCTTATSPVWVIKTKLQLHRNVSGSMTILQCCKRIFKANGLRGFYRGITASYAGITETVLHFVIYEHLKLHYQKRKNIDGFYGEKKWRDYGALMVIAAISKTTATTIAYPHEVVRTRLREETTKRRYRGFFQTLAAVAKQEGWRALYRGLGTQMIRQVPNMAIIMGTYELIIDSL